MAHVCEECAREVGIFPGSPLEDMGGLFGMPDFSRMFPEIFKQPTGNILELLSESAIEALDLAANEAVRLEFSHIGTEHLILGLSREPVGSKLLMGLGVNLDDLQKEVEDMIGRGKGAPEKAIPLSPRENVDDLIAAMGNVGSGVIGEYSHCTFRTEGQGTFYPMPGAHPYLGEISELNEVDEFRLEMLVSPDRVERVIATMLEVHPYEEVAYDLYEVKTPPPGVGFGRIGNMLKQRTLRDYAEHWSDQLDCELRVSGDLDMMVRRVAVCGGSGGELIGVAKAAGADVFITGDIKHHAAHTAKAIDLALIDAGHAETERLIVPELAKELQRRVYEAGINVEVVVSEIDTNPWNKD
jgi:putative NIF3 family GTP cyclohydrolase 1 type 2